MGTHFIIWVMGKWVPMGFWVNDEKHTYNDCSEAHRLIHMLSCCRYSYSCDAQRRSVAIFSRISSAENDAYAKWVPTNYPLPITECGMGKKSLPIPTHTHG